MQDLVQIDVILFVVSILSFFVVFYLSIRLSIQFLYCFKSDPIVIVIALKRCAAAKSFEAISPY